jgi:hypothetical protein
MPDLPFDDELTPTQKYWVELRAKCAELDPECAKRDADMRAINPKHGFRYMETESRPLYLCSLTNRQANTIGGRICIANAFISAKMIIGGTHRLATPEEIDAYEREHTARRQKIMDQIDAQTAPIVKMAESFQTIAQNHQGTGDGAVGQLCVLVGTLIEELRGKRAEPPAEAPNGNGKVPLFLPPDGAQFSMEEPKPQASRRGRSE